MASSACTSRRRCAPRSPRRRTRRCRISSVGGSRRPHRMSCGAATSPTCPTGEGWLYVASVLDLGSRRLLGYSMAGHMRTELVADALEMAVAARGGQTAGIIFHGDRGSQYMSSDYRQLIADLDMVQSVGRTGVCWDNTVAESFWSSLKREVVHRYRFATAADARRAIFAWINRYNHRRLHSSLGYLPPVEWEQLYRQHPGRPGRVTNVTGQRGGVSQRSSWTTTTWKSLCVSTPAMTRRSSSAMVDMPPSFVWLAGWHARPGGWTRQGAGLVAQAPLRSRSPDRLCHSSRVRLARSTGQFKDTRRVEPHWESHRHETNPAACSQPHDTAARTSSLPLCVRRMGIPCAAVSTRCIVVRRPIAGFA